MAENEKKDANNEEDLSPYDRLTSTQKCAILMMLLGCLLYTSDAADEP